MPFSARVPGDLHLNRLAAAVASAHADRRPLLDLTATNPTAAAVEYPDDLLVPLADPRGLQYAPESLGVRAAREAVAGDFARRGIAASPDRIALTASTSEAYSILFKILCDAGDEVLVPRPSYPLFDHLTRLDAIGAVPYALEPHGGWSIDFSSVEEALSPRTRALLVVSPNNPTGSVVSRDAFDRLASTCAARGIALIADEVFADYPLSDAPAWASGALLARDDVLAFTLGGLSKTIGLPQAKLGWIAASGPAGPVADALARLDIACDAYLSVSTPVQLAAAELLDRGAVVRRQIQQRVRRNYDELRARAAGAPACRVLHADGGWSAVVRVPTLMPEEDLVLTLLARDHLLVHPGYFFDFPSESFVVLSLLTPPATFGDGIDRLFRHFDCSGAAP